MSFVILFYLFYFIFLLFFSFFEIAGNSILITSQIFKNEKN